MLYAITDSLIRFVRDCSSMEEIEETCRERSPDTMEGPSKTCYHTCQSFGCNSATGIQGGVWFSTSWRVFLFVLFVTFLGGKWV